MNFEKDIVIYKKDEKKIYKLKKIFTERIRKIFLKGVYNDWSLRKPFGYTGDFKIIDDIYQNNPPTTGFPRLFDNYFQMSAISVAVRNRKEDFERLIINFCNERKDYSLRIMNLGSGSCREVKEILSSSELLNKNVIFDCYDHEKRAIEYARNLLCGFTNINFIQENILKITAAKNIHAIINKNYDFIYATGLIDYFDNKIAIRLIKNLKKLLNTNSILAIANVRDKYSNPSVHYMEWVGDWNLFYRTDEEFKKFFIDAGFKEDELEIQYEQQGIIQYILAYNKKPEEIK